MTFFQDVSVNKKIKEEKQRGVSERSLAISQRWRKPERPRRRSSGLPVAHSCATLHSRNAELRSVIVGVQRACRGPTVSKQLGPEAKGFGCSGRYGRRPAQRDVLLPGGTGAAGRSVRPIDAGIPLDAVESFPGQLLFLLSLQSFVFTCRALLVKEKYEL